MDLSHASNNSRKKAPIFKGITTTSTTSYEDYGSNRAGDSSINTCYIPRESAHTNAHNESDSIRFGLQLAFMHISNLHSHKPVPRHRVSKCNARSPAWGIPFPSSSCLLDRRHPRSSGQVVSRPTKHGNHRRLRRRRRWRPRQGQPFKLKPRFHRCSVDVKFLP